MQPRYFYVSYSRHEAIWVEDLVRLLRTYTLTMWIDLDSLTVGDDWMANVQAAIAQAKAMVLICSPYIQQSEWVRYELAMAARQMLPIIPIVIDGEPDAVIPVELQAQPYGDLRLMNADSLNHVVRILERF
jgi:hypothetical protein